MYSSFARRRLLQASVKADVTIAMPDQASASAAAGLLTEANINKAMASANLPMVSLLSPASVSGVSGEPTAGSRFEVSLDTIIF